ncbi:MFS transporter [Kitasatospora sp. LaBMicrA B282]|uniref:MFS transporter n=1 Tax=Kitasatospora sp. LaBMicrA B282 TaxID=3420949 RepID=UPI003D0F1056
MALTRYRRILAHPGITPLMLLGFFAKIAVVAVPVVLNLGVVIGLHRGFGEAGLAITVWTVGVAVGGPLHGRLMDRFGVRPLLAASVLGQLLFWELGPSLPYPALVAAGLGCGLLNLPGFAIVRLRLAIALPEEQRSTGFALDAMTSNISYMVGPALGVTVATAVSGATAMRGLGLLVATAGIGLALLNPVVRDTTRAGAAAGDRPARIPLRACIKPGLLPVLAATTATTLATAGYESAIVGGLRHAGQVQWAAPVLTVCGFCSLLGALCYGTLKRPPAAAVISLLVGLATLLGGLASGDWRWLCLAMALPAALCSPAFAATASAASKQADPGTRGVVMGCYSAAMTLGNSLGAPLAGAVMDSRGPLWAFTTVALTSAAVSTAALLAGSRLPRTARPDARPAPAARPAEASSSGVSAA